MKKLFKNVRLIDADGEFLGDMLVEDGKIEKIDKNIDIDEECERIDLKNKTALTGFIDMHSHFRDPGFTYKEDIITGSKAALKGGYTTVCAMANTKPVTDSKDVLEYAVNKAKNADLINYIPISAIGKNLEDKELVDIKENLKYTRLFSNDGKTVLSDEFMEKALIKSREMNFLLLTHCDPEEEIIERDLKLLEKVGGNLHICHISTKKSLILIKKAKEKGLNVTCEITPHHTYSYNLDYKVAPKIGTKEDNEYLIEGIKNKDIDIHATDHAPHSKDDKEKGAPGIDNIEVAFAMLNYIYDKNDIPIQRLLDMMSKRPAEILRLKKGLFKEGYDADFVIADLDYRGIIDKDKFISKSNNTPYDKKEIKGNILQTYVGGERKW